jgi:starch phosphorylase
LDANRLRDALSNLASSHVWTWTNDLRDMFDELAGDRPAHPVVTVAGLGDDRLDALLADAALMELVQRSVEALEDARATAHPIGARPVDIAYFSPEFGISELVPQYSGGLGILAGDHVKASNDLAIPLVGVGLFYSEGFFRQDVADGRQVERYERYEPTQFGAVEACDPVDVPIGDRDVTARVWSMSVGRIQLVLLDTDHPDNSPEDRCITDRLYSGDRRHRIEQELVLGVGGARALAALGISPRVFHLNEGHAGFLILELLDRRIADGASLADALQAVQRQLVFTTHTPVPAGIDRFSRSIACEHLQPWADAWRLPTAELFELGRDPSEEPPEFNMAVFCLRTSARANGVSKLHGRVSRELFAHVPGGDAIGSVTNGVHARTWTAPALQRLLDRTCGPTWADGDAAAWQRVGELDDDAVRDVRRAGGVRLAEMVRDRTGVTFDPDVLTIGFARRFATYKRATLLLGQRDRLVRLLADDTRPIQLVFAGKAHPSDDPGKALLAEVVAFAATADARRRFVFVADYDIEVARAMYAGCDVWLNTPVRPHEASGTSGEKSALNGGLNCSIGDGWWDEMADGRNGWTIRASASVEPAVRDRAESAAALDVLTSEIVPTYYREGDAWSSEWLARVRHCWADLGPRVTAARMVNDYWEQLYRPTIEAAT